MGRYLVFSYGNEPGLDPYLTNHGQLEDREAAERMCRELVMDIGRSAARVMRSPGGTILYAFDQEEAAMHRAVTWTADLAEEVLRAATWAASRFLRVIIDEGGEAAVGRIKELTGHKKVDAMKTSLNTATRRVANQALGGLGRLYLVDSHRDVTADGKSRVSSYSVLPERMTLFDEALRRRGC